LFEGVQVNGEGEGKGCYQVLEHLSKNHLKVIVLGKTRIKESEKEEKIFQGIP